LGADFFVGFSGLAAEAVGTPVFFSGAMNLPRAVRGRSGAAMMLIGWAPAWEWPLLVVRVFCIPRVDEETVEPGAPV
jgi:hypothetical protein